MYQPSSGLAKGKIVTDNGHEALKGLAPVLESVQPEHFVTPEKALEALDQVCSRFVADRALVEDAANVLFGSDITAYGTRAASIFSRWEGLDGQGPSAVALLDVAIEKLVPDMDPLQKQMLLLAGVLAEVPNECQYHGNFHYRKVLFHAIRMAALHQQLGDEALSFTDDDLFILMLAATIHDLGHEGGDNLRDGVYTPGYMEQRAFDIAYPYFEEMGLPKDICNPMKTAIFCTDITFFAGENSPCVRLKMIHDHMFGVKEQDDISLLTMGKLGLLADNPKLVRLAVILHEADIASSAGLTYEQTEKETIDIIEERGLKTAGPGIVLNFIREQLDCRFLSPEGKALFEMPMQAIIELAEDDYQGGRETFYEDGVASSA